MYCFISLHHLLPKNPIRDFIPFRALVLFSTSVAENPTSTNIFTVESRSLSREKAINAVRVRSLENPGSVVEFLKQNGFEDTQIKKLISRHPRILYANVDKTLKPKFTCFQEIGLSGRPFVDFVTKYPNILRYSAENKLRPSINFLRTVLRTDDNVIKAIGKNGWLLCSNFDNITMPNVETLRRCGVPDCQITPFRTLISTASTENHTPKISLIKSARTPDSVLGFLKQRGFEDTHIQKLFSTYPRLLTTNLEKTLKNKVIFFQELGFSGASFVGLFSKGPRLHFISDSRLRSNFDFLLSLLHTNDNVISAVMKCSRLLYTNVQNVLVPNIEILRRCGVPDCQICNLVLLHPRLITQSSNWIESLTVRVEEIGIKRGSRMFVHATFALSTMSKTSFEAKIKLFKSFGWSDEDIMSAFRKTPGYLTLSESKIQTKMCFLMDEIGYKPSQIAFRPYLLPFSLEKRLVPRHEVLKILKSRELLRKHVEFSTVACMSESNFLKKYVLQYLDKVPELQEAYIGSKKSEKK